MTPLRNYTTEVPANRSIQLTEDLLVQAGARNISKEYGPKAQIVAISFILEIEGKTLAFKLPGKVQEVFVWLQKKYPKGRPANLLAQAERITWKLAYEWVHLQLSMIQIGQMEKLEAFFPHLYNQDTRETFYMHTKKTDFKALLP